MAHPQFALVALLLVAISLRGAFSISLSVSSLTVNQKETLEKFRVMVLKYLPREYMKGDAYLLRFLSVKSFNLTEAKTCLKQNLARRKMENIDSILWMDWSDYPKRFPYDLATMTAITSSTLKDGPALYIPYGIWNINEVVQSGESEVARLLRYASIKMVEDADRNARHLRTWRYPNDVAQFDIIINLDGFSVEKHGCVDCVQLLLDIIQKSEAHFSGAVDNLVFLNAPPSFDEIYPWISSGFRKKSHVTITVQKGRATLISRDGRVERIVAKDNLVTSLEMPVLLK